MIAALFVDADGIYAGRPDVDLWPVGRDARAYAGPFPVVAHPPCERWGVWARTMYGRIGEDEGCFASALESVETWGGVIEHPASSDAWVRFGLPPPPAAGGWVRNLYRPGWSAHVEQAQYGHRAVKPTWLYYVGPLPPELRWGKADIGHGSAPTQRGGRGEYMSIGRRLRRATPPAFADLLLSLAESANRDTAQAAK